jgi:hypothetical protein
MVTVGPMAQATLYLLKKVVVLFVCYVEIFQITLPHHAFSNMKKPLMRRSGIEVVF